VVYNNTTYISQSRTVVQNIHRTDNTYINNIHENAAGERRQAGQPQAAGVLLGRARWLRAQPSVPPPWQPVAMS
jgi:hypothetical protein